MGELRAEIPQLVATQTSAMRTEIEAALKELHDRSLVEISTQVTQLKALVESQQSTAVAEIGRITQEKFDTANGRFITEQTRLTASVEDLQRAISAVGAAGAGEFEKFSAMLAQHEKNVVDHTKIVGDSVHNLLRNQVNGLKSEFFEWSVKVDGRLAAHDVIVDQSAGAPRGSTGGRAS